MKVGELYRSVWTCVLHFCTVRGAGAREADSPSASTGPMWALPTWDTAHLRTQATSVARASTMSTRVMGPVVFRLGAASHPTRPVSHTSAEV